ncbi:PEP-CTERM sorting domain-containing protein [Rubritalea spongiae]|uniref:PEP-CTERM sorting domain-containing protein n=1 Tax=Rubritalea spongiae TaxID=430797 RepID=A0ABW5DYZ9_9BACT
MKKIKSIAAITILAAGATQAATITWTGFKTTGDPTDVLNAGTTVEAFNATNDTGNVTVNGVTFTNTDTLLSNGAGPFFTDFTSSDPGYQALLETTDFAPNTGATFTRSFSGLTTGQEYAIQYWFVANNVTTRTMTVTASGTSTTGSGDLILNANGNGTDLNSAIGTFTADAATQDFTIISSANGVRITALQLRAVPEPSSAALLSIGGLSLIMRRAKK